MNPAPVLVFIAIIALVALPAAAREDAEVSNERTRPLLFPNTEAMEKRKEAIENARAWIEQGKGNVLERGFGATTQLLTEREKMVERLEVMASTSAERREAWKARMEERRENFASTTALRKVALEESIKERVLLRAEHAARLLDAMIERLNGLSLRIEARIEILADAGVDTSDAQAALSRANVQIEEAEDAVEKVKEAMNEALSGDSPREALQRVKPLAQAAKTAIREAHQALMEAVKVLPKREPAAD